jgi:hypothetical protein
MTPVGTADLLVHAGEIQRRPLKRSMDTGLLMYELIDSGPESDRGRTESTHLQQSASGLTLMGQTRRSIARRLGASGSWSFVAGR